LDVSVELAINPDANDGLTIEQLAEVTGTEPSTIVRWRCKFRAMAHYLFDRLAQMLAKTSLPVARWLWIGSLDPPERRVFRLVAFLRSMLDERFPFSDLAFINLLLTHHTITK
jgi:transcriptional regulator with XRE-family HTH domain